MRANPTWLEISTEPDAEFDGKLPDAPLGPLEAVHRHPGTR